MESFKNLRFGLGFIILASTPPYLVYDFHRMTTGHAGFFNWLTLFLAGIVVVASLAWLFRLKGERYLRLRFLWEWPASLLLLIITSPLLLIAFILIKLESSGPSVYSQERIGVDRRKRQRRRTSDDASQPSRSNRRKGDRRDQDLGGKPFTMYKLRTMVEDAESQTGVAWSTGDRDPRVTRVGHYLRKTHADELLQLYNVLKGDMSIIGPRPERAAFIEELSGEIDGYRERLKAMPGITGLAQVHQESDESLEDVEKKLQYDKEYIEKTGLITDIKIIFRTVIVITSLCWVALKRRTTDKLAPKTPKVLVRESFREKRA